MGMGKCIKVMYKLIFNREGRHINAVLLAKFNMDAYVFKTVRGFLGRKKSVCELAPCDVVLVFIPWKHYEKELAFVHAEDVISKIEIPPDFYRVKSFISTCDSEDPYSRGQVEVRNFAGYKFIFDNNSFIADLRYGQTYAPLTALYQKFPELLEAQFEESE